MSETFYLFVKEKLKFHVEYTHLVTINTMLVKNLYAIVINVTHWHILSTETLHLNWVSNYIALKIDSLLQNREWRTTKHMGMLALGIYRGLGPKYY